MIRSRIGRNCLLLFFFFFFRVSVSGCFFKSPDGGLHTKRVTPLSCSVLIWRRCYLRCRARRRNNKASSFLVLFHTNRWGGITVHNLPPCAPPTLPRSPAHLPAVSSSACEILFSAIVDRLLQAELPLASGRPRPSPCLLPSQDQ